MAPPGPVQTHHGRLHQRYHRASSWKENLVNVCCGYRGTAVNVVAGQLLVFHDILPNGELDPLTSHQSCPVLSGEKVVTVRFIREEACRVNKFFSWRKWNGNVFCEDDHTRCAEWAARGHCTTSDRALRERMVGDANWPGFCERTCEDCRPLEETVVALRKELGQVTPAEAMPGRRQHAEMRMGEVYV